MSFAGDDKYQRELRDRYLLPYYERMAHEGRYITADGSSGTASMLQREMHVDTLVQTKDSLVSIDEKIVRWPGYEYEQYALESWSCTIPGKHSLGWMYTCRADLIAYCFERPDGLLMHLLPFGKLQAFFIESKNEYRTWRSEQINRTECRLVDIEDVRDAGILYREVALRDPDEAVKQWFEDEYKRMGA